MRQDFDYISFIYYTRKEEIVISFATQVFIQYTQNAISTKIRAKSVFPSTLQNKHKLQKRLTHLAITQILTYIYLTIDTIYQ